MATFVGYGAWTRPTQPPPPRHQLLSPPTPISITTPFTGAGALTAVTTPRTSRTVPFTGTGTLTATTGQRTTATTAAAFTGTGLFTAAVIHTAAVTDNITRIQGAATPPVTMQITLGGAVTGLEPFTPITITADITGTTTTGVTYTLTQTIGPPVPVTGTGPTWTYRTPGVPTTQTAAQIRFLATATKTGFTTTTTSVDHYIYPAPAMDYDTTGAPRGISIQV